MASRINMVGWTLPEDQELMILFYNQNPKRLDGLTGDRLVRNIEWRIYTEWCCNPSESVWLQHINYQGEAFAGWVRDEAHYALERADFRWNTKEKRFDANGNFHETYRQTKEKVLQAIVKKAVEFFRECRNYQWPVNGDSRNLRANLESYLT